MEQPKRVAERKPSDPFFSSLRHISRASLSLELLAGVTLLAIAIPEQLATARLAAVPSFLAILAFIVATGVFAMFGSNPVLSIGADSTIAPLFAVALLRLALPNSPHYLALVAVTAVLAGVLILLIGLFRLGWLADFLSAPIVTGFMIGVGLTIIVHQLPDALGVQVAGGTFVHRLGEIGSKFGSINGWCIGLTIGTLAVIVIGERFSKKVPFALLAVVLATLVSFAGSLQRHGVATLGVLHLSLPAWRFQAFTWRELAVVSTTAVTVAIVVLSQSAATSRDVADEMGVDDDINRDFVAIGLANIASGVVGAIPVNASPARTGVVRMAGGRTQLVGLLAAGAALLSGLLAPVMRDIPYAVLAGVLFYVASRLIKIRSLRAIGHVDLYEFALALVTTLAVVFIGVQEGIAVAVLLAIVDQTRRSARPQAVILGRRPDSTSWEPVGLQGAVPVDHVAVLLFTAPLYFANAALFRTEVHATLRLYSEATHLVIDAAAISDIDFTGLGALDAIVTDLGRDGVDVVVARASERVTRALSRAPSSALHVIRSFATVDEAVQAVRT